ASSAAEDPAALGAYQLEVTRGDNVPEQTLATTLITLNPDNAGDSSGFLSSLGQERVYTFRASETGMVTVEVDGRATHLDSVVLVYNSQNQLLGSGRADTTGLATATVAVSGRQDYFVRVLAAPTAVPERSLGTFD